MNQEDLRERIDSLAELEENWDSYGSAPISLFAIVAAKQIASGWCAVPLNGGGVQLEVHVPGGELEIEICPHGNITGTLTNGIDTDACVEGNFKCPSCDNT